MRLVAAALGVAVVSVIHVLPAHAQVSAATAADFDSAAVEFEDLTNIDVRDATMREQRIFRAPTAVHVMATEEIRRSGARSLPEVLRLVVGLDVAELAGGGWSVSARGLGGASNNQVLVVIDGRPVSSPSSDIRWEAEPIPLEDIDRIEVVRGPGAVLWGADAVNGVVSIWTRRIDRTDGWLVSGASGGAGRQYGLVRFGRTSRADKDFRIWANYDTRSDRPIDAASVEGSSRMTAAGLRADLELTQRTDLEIEALVGDGMFADRRASIGSMADDRSVRTRRASMMGRWEFTRAGNAEWPDVVVQFLVDATRRGLATRKDDYDVYDTEFRHRVGVSGIHDLTWGAGHRAIVVHDGADAAGLLGSRDARLSTVFVQDNIVVVPTKLILTAGARLSHHSDGGLAFDPELRWAWSRTARQTLWASLSRGSRPPSLADASLREDVPSGLDRDLRTIRVTAAESGYRIEPAAGLTIDTAAFVNSYGTIRLGHWSPGRTYGIETHIHWRPSQVLAFDGWYSALRGKRTMNAMPADPGGDLQLSSPSHQWQIRSHVDLGATESDVTFGYSGAIPFTGVDAYRRLDVRIARPIHRDLELSFTGHNLLGSSQFIPIVPLSVEPRFFPRSLTLKATWTF